MRLVVLSLFLAVGPGLAGAQAGDTLSGPPTVIDGDSLEVAGERVQLYGIDAPEFGELCEKDNGRSLDCGRIARTAMLDLTAGYDVVCRMVEPAAAVPLANCEAGGFSLNRNMVYTGWAVVDRSVTETFIEIEAEAKQKERGLWQFTFQAPPWPEVARPPR